MPKIALIGAGSIIFTKTLVHDILATPALAGSEIRLMSRTWPKLERVRTFVERMIAENGVDATVWATLDRREALRDADYVIVMIQVGGVDAFQTEYPYSTAPRAGGNLLATAGYGGRLAGPGRASPSAPI